MQGERFQQLSGKGKRYAVGSAVSAVTGQCRLQFTLPALSVVISMIVIVRYSTLKEEPVITSKYHQVKVQALLTIKGLSSLKGKEISTENPRLPITKAGSWAEEFSAFKPIAESSNISKRQANQSPRANKSSSSNYCQRDTVTQMSSTIQPYIMRISAHNVSSAAVADFLSPIFGEQDWSIELNNDWWTLKIPRELTPVRFDGYCLYLWN